MKLLVTGGAGYIGSVVAAMALREGHQVTVLDDLSTGHADAVPAGAAFAEGRVHDEALVQALLADAVDAVLHFAANSLVGESVANPARYWENNLGGTLALLEAMRVTGVGRMVFSSTAAVYGEPERTPIDETAPTRPTNPYGATKVAVDTALAEHARMHRIGAVSLRYFNVAGAQAGLAGQWLGERHDPETHLIPSILAVALGTRGNDADGGNGAGGDGTRVCSCTATTTRPRTAPASATTSTSPTWPGRTCSPSRRAFPASTRSTTSAAVPGFPTSKCSEPAVR